MVKNVPANAENGRDQALIPGLGRSPEVGNSNPLQFSLPGKCCRQRNWWSTVHGVKKEVEMTEYTHTPFFKYVCTVGF